MNKSELFTKAHKLARELMHLGYGCYAVALKIVLKEVYAEIKISKASKDLIFANIEFISNKQCVVTFNDDENWIYAEEWHIDANQDDLWMDSEYIDLPNPELYERLKDEKTFIDFVTSFERSQTNVDVTRFFENYTDWYIKKLYHRV